MKQSLLLAIVLLVANLLHAQIPVNMSAQKNFTYTETFSDIGNWLFNTNTIDGTFTYGLGADAWRGNIASGTATIPSATRIIGQTTSFQLPFGSGTAISSTGIHKSTSSMILLATGTTDNNNAVAMDLFLDFTGVTAGTLSFDWASLSNGTGNRAASLRMYTSIDGSNFTELTAANVLNFINGSPTSGTIANVALPSNFTNAATAQIRFYCHNGSGGTTGSRPRINIDNLSVTAIPTSISCTTPSAQPTNFSVGTVTNYSIQGNFTNAVPASDNYMVIASSNNALSAGPVNGTTYSIGDNLGDGSVVAFTHGATFTVTGLAPSTSYNFFIYAMNSNCNGGPTYAIVNRLIGSATTLAGGSTCVAPISQPTTLTFTSTNTSTIKASFKTSVTSDEYLIVRSTAATLSALPVNKTVYNPGDALGGGIVVARSADSSFNALGLASGTQYYFFVYGLSSKNCNNGPNYNIINPLTGIASTNALTACATPIAQPTTLNLTASNTSINGSFASATNTDEYLVLMSTFNTLSTLPQDGTNYTIGNTLGNATIISNTTATAFYTNNLIAATTYYFYVFAKNSICTNGPKYLPTNPLIGSTTTTTVAAFNYYFGNLHAHTIYSDGGKDNSSTNPAAAFAYAKNSLCMDYLGISEHNHSDAGMNITNWQPGIDQATAATSSTFLALYGMEYGVISNGGHVLIYGTNQLIGWEPNNYNVFVPKSDYTSSVGLFRTINALGGNAFATLAHPNYGDYNNLTTSTTAFSATADSAIAGAALSSGPAFSTSTNYSDPASAFSYYEYFKTLLAKGYHVGPLMDHDNHNTTFGRTSNTRTAFIAPSLSKTEFLKAMKGRHFYATEDCDTRVNFTLNNQQMGSIVSGNNYPSISVWVSDPTNTSAVAKIKIMYGRPGSNISAVALDSVNANIYNFTDYNMLSSATNYYFAEITIAGNNVVTAPIWYTYNAVLPVTLLNFKASVTSNKSVLINWSTANEINNQLFVLEKSIDGVHFVAIDSVLGAGNTTIHHNYTSVDAIPFEGINYYRLKQIDTDGKTTFSNVISIDVNRAAINYFTVYPNPVGNQLTLNINAKSEQIAKLIITDIFGRPIKVSSIHLSRGNQQNQVTISELVAGNYSVTVMFNDIKVTKKIIKL
jgi:trimeric autotransporter adhesin